MPYVKTEAMQVFLNRFAATIGDDEHVAMVLDQAGWHGSGALRIPDNITLVPLPPYSPELNPVERVWLHLKERFLSHRLLADYDAIADAACNAWNRLCVEVGHLTSLCSYPSIPRSDVRRGGITLCKPRKISSKTGTCPALDVFRFTACMP